MVQPYLWYFYTALVLPTLGRRGLGDSQPLRHVPGLCGGAATAEGGPAAEVGGPGATAPPGPGPGVAAVAPRASVQSVFVDPGRLVQRGSLGARAVVARLSPVPTSRPPTRLANNDAGHRLVFFPVDPRPNDVFSDLGDYLLTFLRVLVHAEAVV